MFANVESLYQVHVRWSLDSIDENSSNIDIKVGKVLNTSRILFALIRQQCYYALLLITCIVR